ncbi:CehA/McbA family metallohydrolase [Neobacillus sp. NPDC093127]|uniref:CehA/McbA family metallohydrolase n=1 Tax=Neobacillus sp. NPDC093127 TaxID=3364296 RepID=UPI0038046E2C
MHNLIRKYKKWVSLFLTALMLLSMVHPQMAKAATDPVTLAKWDFSKGNNLIATDGIAANLTKALSVTGAAVSSYAAGPTSGISVPNATPWTNSPSFWKVALSTKDYQNITLSSKQYSSSTGPKDFKLQYSLNDTTWTDVPNATVLVGSGSWTTGGLLTNVSLPAETNDKDVVYVRWLLNSNLAAKNDGSAIVSTGTSRIGLIEFKGDPKGTPTVEKTAAPNGAKITYASYTSVTGTAGAVANNAQVKIYDEFSTLLGSATAGADGSFSATITNPQSKALIYVSAQETGKDASDKVSVSYTGVVIQKTATPIASKITYATYTNVTGTAGAVVNNATVKLYFDDNTVVATTTAGADGSFSVTFANPQSKSVINVMAQEAGKDPSDKVAVTYTGPTGNPTGISPGDVVFSQLYVNGGNSGAFYKTKFFELYNNTDKDIDLNGWSIAYSAAATMNFGAGQALSGVIKAHGYFLVVGATGATGADLPVKADVTTTLNPSGSTGGALVLAKKKTAVTGVDDPDAIDLLAFTNGTAVFKNPLYWGSPISDSTVGGGTIQRKTNIGTEPQSAYGLGNGWFTKDPSKDFTMNKPAGANYPQEMVVHNSKFMLTPDSAKIAFTKAGGTATIAGQAGSVPASSTVKVYVENGGTLTSPQQATAAADGSFSLTFPDASNSSAVYVTHTDGSQTAPLESSYARINVAGTPKTVTAMSELRKNDTNGLPINLGYSTTIEGVATSDNTPSENVKTNFTIQDATGAIKVVNNLDPSTTIKAGTKYSIDGRVVFTAGLTQFVPTAIRFVGSDTLPNPEQIAISAINETKESKLVTFNGKVTNIPANGPDYDITVSDESGANLAIVRVQGTLGDLEQGSSYTFTGIVSQYKKAAPFTSGYFLLPRNAADIKGQLVLTHTALTKAYMGIDVAFTAMAKNADSVILYYKGATDSSYQQVMMNAADGKNYNGKILKANVPVGKLLYYIEAVTKDDKKSVGTAAAPITVDVVEDTDGPAFSNELPVTGDNIDSRYPVISVKMDDPNGVNTSSATIKIDGKDFTSKAAISETEIKLILTKSDELTEGEHTVAVFAKDKLGNPSTFTWKFTVAKRFVSGNHYRGTTHNHTNISHDAAGSPEQALKDAEKYHYDYFAFSDHSHDIDASLVNKDTVDHGGMKERTGGSDWQLTKDLAKQYTKDGKFVVFPAFEMTSTTWGHSNVFGTDNFIDRVVNGGAYQKLQNYYAWTLTYDNIVAQFNHPKMSANAFDNFIPYDKNVDKLFTMLEVGNGSGKYSYANAEDKYYSALDLGWHVAPTYGEDNHDATWGQTKKRTVIVASDLSQNSLLEAMKKMRVYMSEDPNFTLDVSANGFYMGSTVDTNTLDFKITGSDPVLEKASDPDYSYIKTPSNDSIAKVELLSNRGRVIDTYVPTKDVTSFNWEPSVTVAGGQQWFVVKVTQKDGDQIYSSPIWSPAKDLAVSVSNVSTPDGAIVGGVATTLTAGVSNLGSVNVNKVKAKFYYDTIDVAHFIGEAVIDSLPANTSGNASVAWANPVAGTHNIIVMLSADDGHDLGDNKYEQSFVIKAPLGKTIMIDGTHGNENTKADLGTYKDNLKLFTTLMKQQGYTVAENSVTLSDDVLKNVSVLMITHPTSAYTSTEIAAITKFVTAGGSLLMTEKSNFGGSNQNLNDILANVGSSILVNNDGVFDETKEGNFWGTPLTSNFSVRLHPTPVKNTLTDFVPTIEYYSGASLAKNDGTGKKAALTDSSSVTILARGNESTFQDSPTIKADSVSYNVRTAIKGGPALEDVTGGSVIPLIASEEIGKGRVVISAMNVFNDKQIDQTFSPKGNAQFGVNVVNWLTYLEPKVKSLGDARLLAEGTNVVVEGTVTTTAFFDAVYIQDNTGGIMAFNDVPAGSLKIGDKVRIYGHIKTFENNLELEFGSFAESVVKLGAGTPVEPKLVTTKDSNAEANQGQLVKVIGKVVSKYDENSYEIDDGSGKTLVFTDGYIINQSGPVPNLKVGDTLEAVGLTGKFSEGNRIRVRDTRELVGTIAPDTKSQGQLLLGDKPLANVTFSLYTAGANQVWYDFTTDANGNFTYNLPDGDYKLDGVWVDPTWYPLNGAYKIKNGLVNGTNKLVISATDYQVPTDPGKVNVSGKLTKNSGGYANIPFSIHTLDGKQWYDTRTDAKGQFALLVPDGKYQIDGIWDGAKGLWQVLNQQFEVKDGKLVGAPELLVNVKAIESNVTGKLTQGDTPLANTIFSIHTTTGEPVWYDTKTDANGNFSFSLNDGTYKLEGIWVDADGTWYELQKEFTVSGSLQLDLKVPVKPAKNVTGVLTKGTEVLGDVVFSFHTTTGDTKWYDVKTAADGSFGLVMPNGAYQLDGVWVASETKWYVLNLKISVEDGKLVGTDQLLINLTK